MSGDKRTAISSEEVPTKKACVGTATETLSAILAAATKWEVKHYANKKVAGADAPFPHPGRYPPTGHTDAFPRIRAWAEYTGPTPCVSVPKLAEVCGVAQFMVKDESNRCGVTSFKVLGGALAVEDFALKNADATDKVKVATCSAGNHGVGVAWGAKRAGIGSVVYLAPNVSESIANKMRKFGAEVRRVPGTYEDSLRVCQEEAKENGWQHIQDVRWEGYEEVPQRIHAGYGLMAEEILDQMKASGWPTHVFVNVGVGGLATGIFGYIWGRCAQLGVPRPRFISVEANNADGMLCSARAGEPRQHPDYAESTIQTGLCTKGICPMAWEVCGTAVNDFIAIPDEAVGPAMKLLAEEARIAGGESAVAGIIAMLAASVRPDLKKALELGPESRIVVIVCEGPPDHESYKALTGRSAEDVVAA